MRNIRLTLAYDGTHYVGWQIQPNGLSVQAAVKSAIEKLTGETANVLAAGRTDSGVHALGQVANFRTESAIPCEKIRTGLQRFLPEGDPPHGQPVVTDDDQACKRCFYVEVKGHVLNLSQCPKKGNPWIKRIKG